jgi:hypothetical protein
MVASIGLFLPGQQGKARGLMSQGDFQYPERGFLDVKMAQKKPAKPAAFRGA